jgi:hypothetical protein
MKVKKLLPGGLLTSGMRMMVKAAKNMNIKKTPDITEKKDGGLVKQGYPKIAKKGWK